MEMPAKILSKARPALAATDKPDSPAKSTFFGNQYSSTEVLF